MDNPYEAVIELDREKYRVRQRVVALVLRYKQRYGLSKETDLRLVQYLINGMKRLLARQERDDSFPYWRLPYAGSHHRADPYHTAYVLETLLDLKAARASHLKCRHKPNTRLIAVAKRMRALAQGGSRDPRTPTTVHLSRSDLARLRSSSGAFRARLQGRLLVLHLPPLRTRRRLTLRLTPYLAGKSHFLAPRAASLRAGPVQPGARRIALEVR